MGQAQQRGTLRAPGLSKVLDSAYTLGKKATRPRCQRVQKYSLEVNENLEKAERLLGLKD